VFALPSLRFINLSALSQHPAIAYTTLTHLTPSSATPKFLYNLQQSNLSTSWIGEIAGFHRKKSPSTWEWSHILLTEGRWIILPDNCKTVQTWTYELDTEDAFRTDPEDNEPDKQPDEMSGICLKYARFRKHMRRFCVLTFYTEQVEERYTQHLKTVGQDDGLGKELDMHVHLIGRILHTKEKLGRHAKTPMANSRTKKKKR
jgi:hypothetical protein